MAHSKKRYRSNKSWREINFPREQFRKNWKGENSQKIELQYQNLLFMQKKSVYFFIGEL